MKKRGLSLFLALALCLTLLPAAAFANGEPETSTLHTHYLCGNGETCSHVGGHNETDKTTFATAITQDENGYVWVGDGTQEQPYQCVLSEGTYYLATDLVLKGPPNLKKFGCICIDSDVTLCLNGHTITIIDDRDAFDIRKSMESNPPTPVSYTHSEPTRLLSISYAVFCLKKKKKINQHTPPLVTTNPNSWISCTQTHSNNEHHHQTTVLIS